MHRQLFKHKMSGWGASGPAPYVSPYLLEILSTRPGAPTWDSATGTLVANTNQVVSCSRASSAYCLGDDGLLHLLGANTVRVEPTGLLVEGASTNILYYSTVGLNDGVHGWFPFQNGSGLNPAFTQNTTDVIAPDGGHTATKVVFAGVNASGDQSLVADTGVSPPSGNGCASMWIRAPDGQSFDIIYDKNSVAATITITDQWVRYVRNIGFGQWWIGLRGDIIGTPGSRTIYTWLGQVENVTSTTFFPSSPIVTNGAPATRDADVVTAANPLVDLSQPIPVWSMFGTFAPLAAWSAIQRGNGQFDLLSLGVPTTANCANITGDNASGGRIYASVNDASNTKRFVTSTTGNNAPGSTTLVAGLSVTAAGAMSGQPNLDNPGGLSVMDGQQATFVVGGVLTPSTQFMGHMTDIVVDNT